MHICASLGVLKGKMTDNLLPAIILKLVGLAAIFQNRSLGGKAGGHARLLWWMQEGVMESQT